MGSRESISWLVCGAIALMLVGLVLFGSGGGGTSGVAGPAASRPAAGAPVAAPSGNAVAPVDQPVIAQTVTRILTQSDPKQCTQDMTSAFLRQRFGSEKGTLDRCRRANTPQAEADAKSVAVESVMATPGGATVAVEATSDNSLDGSVLTLSFVHEGGRWKVDQLSNIRIDRARLDQHVRDDLGARGYLPAETSCAITKFDGAVSDQDIERDIIVGGYSPSTATVEADAVSCLSRPTLLRELSQGFTAVLTARGLPPRITRCVVDHITHGVPTSRLRNLLAAGLKGDQGWYKLGYQAIVACAGSGASTPGQSSTV